MSTQAHTPGPWSIYDYGEEESPTLVIHKDSATRICFMATPGSHGDPAIIEANAHLIIAAPDILAALTDMFALMDEGWLVRNTSEDHKPSFAMRQLSFVRRLAEAHAAIEKATGVAP